MATAAEIQTRIDAIDAKLASGMNSMTVGDEQVSYDLDELRRERNVLMRQLAAATGSQYKRVVFKNA